MPTLRMNTERVRDTGRLLNMLAGDIEDQGQRLARAAHLLDMNWEGGSSGSLVRDAHNLSRTVQYLARELDSLGTRTVREADEWELIDANGAEGFSRIDKLIMGAFSGMLGVAGLLGSATDMANIGRFMNWGSHLLFGTHRYGGWKIRSVEFSSSLPPVFGWLAKDVASHKFKIGALGKFGVKVTRGDLLGIGVGSAFETIEQTPEEGFQQAATTALISNALDFAIITGISTAVAIGLAAAGVFAAPAAGTFAALIGLGYGAVLLGGNLLAQVTGSQGLANLMDKIDISTYTDRLVDGIYDWGESVLPQLRLHPDQLGPRGLTL